MSSSSIKVPPHSIEAEQSVLGAILIDRNAIVEVAGFLRPLHFYDERHANIFASMLTLYEERRPIDILTLTEKLKSEKKHKEIGGAGYLTELTSVVPTSAHVEEYGRIIKQDFAKRELIRSSAEITQLSFDSAKNLQEVLDQAEQKIFSISQENLQRNFIPIRDALAKSFDRLDDIQKNGAGMRGVPTGFRDLDDVLAGLQRSNLVILAARPGVGKTAFLLNIALSAAVKEKMPVGFFSLEMSVEEISDRLLVTQSGVDAWKLKTGHLADEDYDRLQDAMGVLAEAPIFIDDTPGISLMEMRTKARRQQLEQGLRLLMVDYLQLVNPGRNLESRVQEVSTVSQALKNLARELNIPLLSASQLNRSVESRGSKKPQLSDLRESGSIEQDADVVMFLYRSEESKDGTAPMDKIPTMLSIDKHRNGALREIPFVYHGNKFLFRLQTKNG